MQNSGRDARSRYASRLAKEGQSALQAGACRRQLHVPDVSEIWLQQQALYIKLRGDMDGGSPASANKTQGEPHAVDGSTKICKMMRAVRGEVSKVQGEELESS